MPYWIGRSSFVSSGNRSLGTMSSASHSGTFSASLSRTSAPFSSSGRRRAVASHPLVPTALARLRPRLHPPPVDDCNELFAHPAALRLPLDLVPVDHPAAVRIQTVPVATGHRTGKLFLGRPDDLERTDATGGSRTVGAVGQEPDAGSVRREPPVRRERDDTVAVRAGDRAGPKVRHVELIDFPLGKEWTESILDAASPFGGQFLESCSDVGSAPGRPLDRGPHHQGCDRIEVVCQRREPCPERLERDAPATRGRIQNRNGSPVGQRLAEPVGITARWRVLESALVAVRILHANPGFFAPDQSGRGRPPDPRGSPITCRNFSLSASVGNNDANTAARAATSGRRAHQTCSRFGAGNGVMGVRSRVLSMPRAEIGSQRSISRVSDIMPSTAQPPPRGRVAFRSSGETISTRLTVRPPAGSSSTTGLTNSPARSSAHTAQDRVAAAPSRPAQDPRRPPVPARTRRPGSGDCVATITCRFLPPAFTISTTRSTAIGCRPSSGSSRRMTSGSISGGRLSRGHQGEKPKRAIGGRMRAERLVGVRGGPPQRHFPVPLVEHEAIEAGQDATDVPADQPEPVALLCLQPVQHRRQVPAVATQEAVVGDVPRLLEARLVGRVVELVGHAIAQQVDDHRGRLLLRRRGRRRSGDDARLGVSAAHVPPTSGRRARQLAEVRLLQKDEPVGVRVREHEPVVVVAQLGGEAQLGLQPGVLRRPWKSWSSAPPCICTKSPSLDERSIHPSISKKRMTLDLPDPLAPMRTVTGGRPSSFTSTSDRNPRMLMFSILACSLASIAESSPSATSTRRQARPLAGHVPPAAPPPRKSACRAS